MKKKCKSFFGVEMINFSSCTKGKSWDLDLKDMSLNLSFIAY